MHFVVLGLGAVGGFYGGCLAQSISDEHKLSFVARGKTYEILKNEGLSLSFKKENSQGDIEESTYQEKNINVYQKIADVPLADDETVVVLLCVKSADTLALAKEIKALNSKNIFVVSVQNGVDNEEKLASVLGPEKVISALTTVAAETLAPGKYLQKGSYGIFIGTYPSGEPSEIVLQIQNVFEQANLISKIKKNMSEALWSKLVWNASFNPMSVYLDSTIGPMLDSSETLARIEAIMAEVVAVAAAKGIKLKTNIAKDHIERTSDPAWRDFRTSTYQDFLKAKKLELDELLGVVIKKGEELNVSTPEASKLYGQLKEKLGLYTDL